MRQAEWRQPRAELREVFPGWERWGLVTAWPGGTRRHMGVLEHVPKTPRIHLMSARPLPVALLSVSGSSCWLPQSSVRRSVRVLSDLSGLFVMPVSPMRLQRLQPAGPGALGSAHRPL